MPAVSVASEGSIHPTFVIAALPMSFAIVLVSVLWRLQVHWMAASHVASAWSIFRVKLASTVIAQTHAHVLGTQILATQTVVRHPRGHAWCRPVRDG